ncbi:MAG: phage portal protein [Lachnospiraceae bacterium]|nr:phage portal protein [Lachnospiraceae bacterium]
MKNPFKRTEKNGIDQAVFKMVTDIGNGFYSWDGKLYKSDIVRACIKPKTKAIGKMVAKHIRTTMQADGSKKIETNPVISMKFLLEEPNELMTGQMMQEKLANQLALNGNAFVLIIRDAFGTPIGLYPIPAVAVEAKYDTGKNLYLKFYYQNGKFSEFYYSEIIHIRDDYFYNDIFGEAPGEALTELMNTITTIDQGIISAIKNSAVIRWLLKFVSAMRDEDLKVKAEEFANNYLSISSNSLGVAAVDAKADAIQVQNNNYVPNAAQIGGQTERVYAFFNTNDKIVHSTYTEDEWISYYEQCIEPVGVQMSGEYTRKLFTRRERGFGNQVVFESSNLTFASMATKLKLATYVDRGIMTPNEVREYLGLTPIDGGDVALLRKDTGKLDGEGDE